MPVERIQAVSTQMKERERLQRWSNRSQSSVEEYSVIRSRRGREKLTVSVKTNKYTIHYISRDGDLIIFCVTLTCAEMSNVINIVIITDC